MRERTRIARPGLGVKKKKSCYKARSSCWTSLGNRIFVFPRNYPSTRLIAPNAIVGQARRKFSPHASHEARFSRRLTTEHLCRHKQNCSILSLRGAIGVVAQETLGYATCLNTAQTDVWLDCASDAAWSSCFKAAAATTIATFMTATLSSVCRVSKPKETGSSRQVMHSNKQTRGGCVCEQEKPFEIPCVFTFTLA